ncbi:MAG: hypothetical protein KatS3mg068_0773 [Candidatus Sericytochromatia bacterium]|nr:MAG: hypothetical protein KatS3mg068_0773 [Candidatus Sericytochromatia bacterium]
MRKIVHNSEILNGKAHFVGTTITVATILNKLASGKSIKEIARIYPQLSEEDIISAIKYAEEVFSRPILENL